MSDDKMKTEICNLGDLFKGDKQWVVPVYQRHYVWESNLDDQIPGMWDDWCSQAEKLLDGKTARPHYFGAIIYSGKKTGLVEIDKMDLVDGQQRLTTFQLALAALRDIGNESGYKDAININKYIRNTRNENNDTIQDDDTYKLFPSRHDRKIFQEIVSINDETPTGASQLVAAYNCFCKSIKTFINKKTDGKDEDEAQDLVKKLVGVLEKALLETFQVVIIQLGKNDEAQQIFASLNGKGEPLSAFDLIRNDIFYRAGVDNKEAERLFSTKWLYFEESFWTTKRGAGHTKKTRAEHFIIDAVIAQSAKEVNHHRIFAEYKKYIREGHFTDVEQELNALRRYGTSYRFLQEPDGQKNTKDIAKLLKLWDLSSINPLVLWIDTRDPEKLSLNDKAILFSMIESYIVRRYICKLASKAFTQNVVSILNKLHEAERQGDNIIGAFKEFLQTETADSKKMPIDTEILSACEQIPIYGNYNNSSKNAAKKLQYILNQIELHIKTNRNESLIFGIDDLSIEHIMPQKWAEHWKLQNGEIVTHENYYHAFEENRQLGSDVQDLMGKRENLINTIGNLTIVTAPLNASLSNSSWESKRVGIAEESSLKLNRDIAKEAEWDEDKIKERCKYLAERINEIWKHPSSE